jgi:hypothetical protein
MAVLGLLTLWHGGISLPKLVEPSGPVCAARASYRIHSDLSRSGNAPD